jgi:L-galactono-1,4-lactone dehydrogenase
VSLSTFFLQAEWCLRQTCRFKEYVTLCKRELFQKYAAVEHWAKIEPAELNSKELKLLQKRLHNRYPMADFNAARKRLDPNSILSNEFVDLVLA